MKWHEVVFASRIQDRPGYDDESGIFVNRLVISRFHLSVQDVNAPQDMIYKNAPSTLSQAMSHASHQSAATDHFIIHQKVRLLYTIVQVYLHHLKRLNQPVKSERETFIERRPGRVAWGCLD